MDETAWMGTDAVATLRTQKLQSLRLNLVRLPRLPKAPLHGVSRELWKIIPATFNFGGLVGRLATYEWGRVDALRPDNTASLAALAGHLLSLRATLKLTGIRQREPGSAS